jgi:hypothetical protein
MTNYQFQETVAVEGGGEAAFPILVHELYSQPHSLLGVPEWATDEQIDTAVEQLEEKLGYELEKPDDYDEIRLSDEEAADYVPKQAGFDPITGEFRAG